MCWNASVSVVMVGIGGAATALALRRGEPPAIWATLAYFTLMEGLQATGYAVVDQCDLRSNQALTLLSYLHIAVQPLFINAFAMAIAPGPVGPAMRHGVYVAAAVASVLVLARLLPLEALGTCKPGDSLCGPYTCLVSGSWHIGWQLPLNAQWEALSALIGFRLQFPEYALAAFGLPLVYGAWRFVLFHALVGPILAMLMTSDPLEMPAIWCLFSVGIVLIALFPAMRYGVFRSHRTSG